MDFIALVLILVWIVAAVIYWIAGSAREYLHDRDEGTCPRSAAKEKVYSKVLNTKVDTRGPGWSEGDKPDNTEGHHD